MGRDVVTAEDVVAIVAEMHKESGVLQLMHRLERARLAAGDGARSVDIRDALSDIVAAAEILSGGGYVLESPDLPSRIEAVANHRRLRLRSLGQDALDEMSRIVTAGRRSGIE